MSLNEFLFEKKILVSYGKLVTYTNDGTSRQSVRQIRLTEFREYNLGNVP